MPAAHRTSPRSRPAASISSEDLGASVLALVTAVEQLPEGAPAARAYRSALRRKGKALAAAGGSTALNDVLARVRASSLKHRRCPRGHPRRGMGRRTQLAGEGHGMTTDAPDLPVLE